MQILSLINISLVFLMSYSAFLTPANSQDDLCPFLKPVYYPTLGGPAFAVGDIDGDDDLDLILGDNSDITAAVIFKNDGTGVFELFGSFQLGSGALDLHDLDGDGDLDAISIAQGGGNIEIARNQGDGNFSEPYEVPNGINSRGLAIGDFDGDSDPDLATTHVDSHVEILLNNGDGTFMPPISYLANQNCRGIATSDLDGDNDLDLAVANRDSDDVSVMFNNGSGEFNEVTNYSVGNSPFGVDIGDLNSDGSLDIAVINRDNNSVSLLLNQGDGTFGKEHVFSTMSSGRHKALILGDVNNDQDLDVVVFTEQNTKPSSEFLVFSNDGTGFLSPPTSYSIPARSMVLGYVNNDARLDLIADAKFENDGFAVMLNGCAPMVGDINGDGILNLLDIAPFVELLSNSGYQSEADINQDGVVSLLDVDPFVDSLTGG